MFNDIFIKCCEKDFIFCKKEIYCNGLSLKCLEVESMENGIVCLDG